MSCRTRIGITILLLLLCIAGAQAQVQPVAVGNQSIFPGATKNDLNATLGQVNIISPNILLSRWNGEAYINVTPVVAAIWTSIARKGGEVDYTSSGMNLSVFDTGDAFEYCSTFRSKPAGNTIKFGINSSQNLQFDLQDELWRNLNIPFSDNKTVLACNATYCNDGRGIAMRPANIVGSYMVYINKTGDYTNLGKMNYGPGKVLSIQRSFITDRTGNISWVNQTLTGSNGIYLLTETMDQNFLNQTNLYPMLLDPRFGYQTAGGTTNSGGGNEISFSKLGEVMTESGTGLSMSVYEQSDSNYNASFALYTLSGSTYSLVLNGNTTVGPPLPYPANWLAQNFTGTGPSLTAQTYYLAMVTTGIHIFFYDSQAGNAWSYHAFTYAGRWPQTFTKDGDWLDAHLPRYVEYNTGGGAAGTYPVDAGFTCTPTAGVRNSTRTCTNATGSASNIPNSSEWYGGSDPVPCIGNYTAPGPIYLFPRNYSWCSICQIAHSGQTSNTSCMRLYVAQPFWFW